MGIDGLLPLLKPLTQKQHISSFSNKTIAIDTMPWIYKGCYNCAMQLNQNIESIDFLYYILQMIDMLKYYNIKPIFIFDGRTIQAKNTTIQKRKKDKQQNKQKGLQYLKNGQTQLARKYLSRCIIIDERIISLTISTLVTKGIQFIISPYEADCQIAKLKRLGMIDAAISQDSDLITFGINVILKLNQNGQCDYIDLQQWRPKDVTDVFLKYFLAFDQLNRIDAAVLAGSDYNKSVKGIGIRRAIKLLTTQATLANVINKLKFKKTYTNRIPQDYLQTVQRSKLIFLFSTVYNPLQKKLQFLRPQLINQHKPEQMTEQKLLQIVGYHYQYTQQVANGRISAKTLQHRDIKILDFPKLFRINKQNMMIHQALIKSKKQQAQQLKKQRLQQQSLKHNNIDQDQLIYDQLNQFKSKATNNRLQQTQQQKQKRKQQRKNRISKLQDLMNTIVDIFGQSEEQQEEQKQKDNSFDNSDQNNLVNNNNQNQIKMKEKKMNTNNNQKDNNKGSDKKTIITNISNHKNSNKNNKDEDDGSFASEEQSVSDDLGNLNPFARKDVKPLNIKPQHLYGSSKKK